jgi:hypothetical protein
MDEAIRVLDYASSLPETFMEGHTRALVTTMRKYAKLMRAAEPDEVAMRLCAQEAAMRAVLIEELGVLEERLRAAVIGVKSALQRGGADGE